MDICMRGEMMKKKVYRERYKVIETKTYDNPYIEGVVVTDELLLDDNGNKKVKRTMKKKSDK